MLPSKLGQNCKMMAMQVEETMQTGGHFDRLSYISGVGMDLDILTATFQLLQKYTLTIEDVTAHCESHLPDSIIDRITNVNPILSVVQILGRWALESLTSRLMVSYLVVSARFGGDGLAKLQEGVESAKAYQKILDFLVRFSAFLLWPHRGKGVVAFI